MAKAPIPGAGKRAAEAKSAKVIHRLRIGDETRTIALGNLPLKERLIVRKATGLPFEAFFGEDEQSFGIDTLMVLWWLAGRAAGDPFLTLQQVQDEWPESLGEDDFDFVEVTPDDEDPSDPQS
jgi:hypothetical protein